MTLFSIVTCIKNNAEKKIGGSSSVLENLITSIFFVHKLPVQIPSGHAKNEFFVLLF